ncbi:uroporphyrinogen-III C-methyltransferase [Algibacillus agarilyticus]|uniref:uroporphyrinogen-III C-methyltransferase n=1 Tax=Algibacillus agarilyticus TaxID=2234133 RepID=UPI000DD0D629|nr:uroporphyrinogen-III C-methyltransferase [Algibacillus agarilyticus]
MKQTPNKNVDNSAEDAQLAKPEEALADPAKSDKSADAETNKPTPPVDAVLDHTIEPNAAVIGDTSVKNHNDDIAHSDARANLKQNVVVKKRNGAVAWLAFLLAFIGLGGVAFIAWQGWLLQQRIEQDQSQVSVWQQDVKQQQKGFQQQVATQLQQTQDYFVQEAKNNQQTLKELMGAIERKTLDIDAEAARADASQLINLAGRKLGLEQDVQASMQILALAQQRIAKFNTPDWSALKNAIAHDLGELQSINPVQTEKTYLDLTSLAALVANLPLNQAMIPDEVEAPQDLTLSDSTDDWLENVHKTWLTLTEKFITVKRRNGNVEALLSPKHETNLRQNMQAKIMHAQHAVINKQPALYKDALQQVQNWLSQYYNLDERPVLEAKSQLNQLINQTIVQDLSQVQLASLALLSQSPKKVIPTEPSGDAL